MTPCFAKHHASSDEQKQQDGEARAAELAVEGPEEEIEAELEVEGAAVDELEVEGAVVELKLGDESERAGEASAEEDADDLLREEDEKV